MNEWIGRRIAQYRIQTLLGQGGMGAVYKAHDTQSHRPVALKLLHPQFAHEPAMRARFLQEAQTAARLTHPAIIDIYDYAAEEAYLYIAMEYMPKGSLEALFRRLGRPMKIRPTLLLLAQVADGLAHAHAQGVLHHDIKPANILLKETARGGNAPQAVISDFGLATLRDASEDTAAANFFIGSLPYMSPERSLDQPADGRSDLYALGVVLYQLLTGRLPFDIQRPMDAVAVHMNGKQPDPPRTLRPELPEAVEDAILTALAKDPAERFGLASEMAEALRAAARSLVQPDARPQAAGQPPVEAAELPADDPHLTQLGSVDWDATPPQMDAVEQTWPDDQDALILCRRGGTPSAHPLDKDEITLGRDPDNDIVLESEREISRRHARLVKTRDGWRVVDQDSTNGTYLEQSRLLAGVGERWSPDQTLRMGPYFLQWRKSKEQAGRDAVSASETADGPRRPAEEPRVHQTERFTVRVEPEALRLPAGDEAEISVNVFNQGEIVDHLRVRIDGLPETWVTLPPEHLSLMPTARGTLTIRIHPPRESSAAAGEHAYQLILISTDQEERVLAVDGVLHLEPYEQFVTDMQPQTVRNRDTIHILIENRGNAPMTYNIVGRDPGEALYFEDPAVRRAGGPRWLQRLTRSGRLPNLKSLGRQAVREALTQQQQQQPARQGIVHKRAPVPAGEQQTFDLIVGPKQRPPIGRQIKSLPFEVQVSSAGGEQRQMAGQLEVTPRVHPWVAIAAGVLTLLLCLALSWVALDPPSYFITPTPTSVLAEVTLTPSDATPEQTPEPGPAPTEAGPEEVPGDVTKPEDAEEKPETGNGDADGGDADGDGADDGEAEETPEPPEEPATTIAPATTPITGTGGIPANSNVISNNVTIVIGPCGLTPEQIAALPTPAPGSPPLANPCYYPLPTPQPTAVTPPTLTPTPTPTVNAAPVAAPDSFDTDEDTRLVSGRSVLSNDSDVDSTALTAVLDAGTAHGRLTFNSDGTFIYDPEPDFFGVDTFNYHASDGARSSAAVMVIVNVQPVNDPPVAVDDRYNTFENTPLSEAPSVLANDSDVDSTALQAVLNDGVENGTLTLANDGTFTYQPNLNFFGTDSFTYHVNDGTADSQIATVIITVGEENVPPVGVDDAYETPQDTPLAITDPAQGLLHNDTDEDGDRLIVSMTTQATHGFVEPHDDGTFTYTPNPGYAGPDSFIYRASDGRQESEWTTVTIDVIPRPRRLVFERGIGEPDLALIDADGSNFSPLTNTEWLEADPAWSPDGSRIAFSSRQNGDNEIHVVNSDGAGLLRLTDNSSEARVDRAPTWSPNDLALAFVRIEQRTDPIDTIPQTFWVHNIYSMNSDGTNPTQLTDSDAEDDPQYSAPAWSPDGTRLAFVQTISLDGTSPLESVDIVVMNLNTGEVSNLTAAIGFNWSPTWSPDGTEIAFVSDRTGSPEIYLMSAGGNNQRQLTGNTLAENNLSWSPDGTQIAFDTEGSNNSDIYVIDIADPNGSLTQLTTDGMSFDPDWEPE